MFLYFCVVEKMVGMERFKYDGVYTVYTMKQVVKVVQQIGNGGHVYVPKEMIGKKVVVSVVEKRIEDIKEEIVRILGSYLEHINGIYLYGSYARGEQTTDSDIDILVVTDGKVKIKQKIKGYDLVSATVQQIENTLDNNTVLILPILKEAKALLNEQLIHNYKSRKLNKKNTKWYVDTTESSLELANNWIKDKDMRSMPKIVYPLVMRLRGLYWIKALAYGKAYSNKQLLNDLISNGLSDEKAKQIYRMYREHRNNKRISSQDISYEDVIKLYKIVEKTLSEVKSLWTKRK